MAAEVYNSNILTTLTKEIHSLQCLIVYELENMKDCKLVNEREKHSQILILTPDELNIDTIWQKLNIDESSLVSKVITSIQVITVNATVTNEGTVEDYENYNVHVDDGHINVDNNVQTTTTNTVDTNVVNQPTVNVNDPIDVTVTNMP